MGCPNPDKAFKKNGEPTKATLRQINKAVWQEIWRKEEDQSRLDKARLDHECNVH